MGGDFSMAKSKTEDVQAEVLTGVLQGSADIAVEETEKVVKTVDPIDPGEELVELTIPMDYSRPMDTQISIQVNGKTVIVQRGVKVNIKRKFAEAYNNAEQQRGRAIAIINSMANME